MRSRGLELLDEEQPPALRILRRGFATTPELRRGLGVTIGFALLSALARLVLPILVQQTLDRGFVDGSIRVGFIASATAVAGGLILVIFVLTTLTYRRVIVTAENTLLGMRVRAFGHIQKLSIAEHGAAKKGILTARVTSDVETLSQFAQWGALSWIVNSMVILGTLALMTFYSWQLALLTVLVYIPLLPVLKLIQRRQLRAYNTVRTRVGDTLARTSEALSGAATIRAYGYERDVAEKLGSANDDLVASQVHAHKFFSFLAPTMDLFGGIATGAVAVVGVLLGPETMTVGEATAFLFLVTILIQPISQLGEVLDQTQTALAGWWKILQTMDIPIDVPEPTDGVALPAGSPSVSIEDVFFSYRTGGEVLSGISADIAASTSVAIVGETGSGKSTLALLLARLADPSNGRICIAGIDLSTVDSDSRSRTIRMVPQDGFLFDTSLLENIRFGRPDATDGDIATAVTALDLDSWVATLPQGLQTAAGERGESISVGERQLVALVRAQLADAGLLILDEATSAVDPETEVRMANALDRLSEGRTTISIAHRLSTAERADLILVMDAGRIVESGQHDDLITIGGVYAGLHADWVGNTQRTAGLIGTGSIAPASK